MHRVGNVPCQKEEANEIGGFHAHGSSVPPRLRIFNEGLALPYVGA